MANRIRYVSFDPDRPYFEPYGLTCVHWQPSIMQRPDYHNEIELNFLLSGSLTYILGGKKIEIEAGKLSAFWAAIPHQIVDFSGADRYFVATIPLQAFLQWNLPEAFVQPIMQGHSVSEPVSKSPEFDKALFKAWERDLENSSPAAEKPVLLEMQARLIRFAYNFVENSDTSSVNNANNACLLSNNGLDKVERMACFISKNYTKKLAAQDVGKVAELHPNYAMKLFQKAFGMTLVSYLTQLRVSHAQRLLLTTDMPITEIALQSGFSSISRFNDAFYRSCESSPRAYRKSHLIKQSTQDHKKNKENP